MVPTDLIDGLLRLEPASWSSFVAEHRPVVIRILSRLVGTADPAAIADLEQEVYTRLLANERSALRGLRGASEGSLRAFVCTTAANVGKDHRRRLQVRGRLRVVDDGVEPEILDGDGADAMLSRVRAAEVLEALGRVVKEPNAVRDTLIFKAYYLDGLTATEIGGMGLGIAAKGVEAVVYRLTARVKEALAAGEEQIP